MKLQNLNALVTGASRGLGLALAAELARAGARVALVARGAVELDRAAAALRQTGAVAYAVPGDVGAKDDAPRIAGAAAALLGPIDLLVHNASDLGPVPLRPLLDTDCEDLERALAVNVVGPQRLTRVVAGSMSLRGNGFMLFISSDAAVEAYPEWGAYGASKAAA
ncbi:MAG: SDR family NAD(P)-dependent oxidoreductase, partial [Polyangiales bacterium]